MWNKLNISLLVFPNLPLLPPKMYFVVYNVQRANKMQFWAVFFLLTTARTIYMFRALSAPIIRSTKNCISNHWCVHWSGWCVSSRNVQGRSTVLFHSRISIWNCVVDWPWMSLLDIQHPDQWHTPVAANTVFSTPDDGCRKPPKHVECTCSG